MTVKELIDKLKEFPEDMRVVDCAAYHLGGRFDCGLIEHRIKSS